MEAAADVGHGGPLLDDLDAGVHVGLGHDFGDDQARHLGNEIHFSGKKTAISKTKTTVIAFKMIPDYSILICL